MKQATTGYYSLIQYCPDRDRLEVANMGVLLFCPEPRYLQARLSPGNERIRHFFGDEAGDYKQIQAMKKIIEHRLEVENERIRNLADLQRFVALTANEILITNPRPVLVEEPAVELAQIFDDLVASSQRREPPREATLTHRLRERLDTPQICNLLKRDVAVKVPLIGSEFTVPFAYQNGRLNLIDVHEFSQRRERDVVRDVLAKAAQGRLIFKHEDPLAGLRQLVIVAALGPVASDHRDRVVAVLADHDVQFYDETNIDQLECAILETAHP